MSLLEIIRNGVIDGDANAVKANVTKAVEEGTQATAILNDALIPAMAEVGKRFEAG